jgi:hypothetical protein
MFRIEITDNWQNVGQEVAAGMLSDKTERYAGLLRDRTVRDNEEHCRIEYGCK